ncbi:hypothetical protein Clacol_006703 [Clathrus columnatus]|uniref:Striatin N-terminal domain-containing protein n=1 Tax=Clathrus columnatus TaxID=1419009 RepID=A0AAV5AHM3_9AGAM|nr:hypothetical protein Clacol_006703 [Clathrus columnatus]
MNPSLNNPQLGGPQSNATIRLPMLGHQLSPNHHIQQQQSLVQQPQQQQQPQSQQQQPQQQQQQPQQNPPIQPPPPPPQSGQDFTLSSVLHFLQTEWRRYERDRNEWEIERAEMRARIALLEGERRSFENIRLDLARRIKMLEYALRMERRQLNTQSQPSTSPTKGSLPKEIQSQKEDSKEDSGSSSPRSEDIPLPDHRLSMSLAGLPNGTHQPNSRPQSWNAPVAMAHQISLANIGKAPPGRDPRSRQRSKEYLKQCLQEITYLTSAHALNPLPNRPLLSNTSLPVSIPNIPQFDQGAFNGRPRKILNDNNGIGMAIPPTNIAKPAEQMQHVNGVTFPTLPNPQGLTQQQNDRGPSVPSHIPLQSHNASTGPQPCTPFPSQPQLNDKGLSDTGADTAHTAVTEPLTAIFRPDETWRDQLRRAGQASVKVSEDANLDQIHSKIVSGAASWDSRSQDEEDDVREDDEDAETEDVSLADENEGSKVWRVKRMLRNHLEAVRAVAFHSQEMCLATGGDDCTVKIWRLDPQLLNSSTAAKTEIEPQMTLRGHSSPITRLVISSNRQTLYSASLDSTICMWRLPPAHVNTYAPYDTLCMARFSGHADAIWDLVLLRNETLLVSSGADGRVIVWDVNSVTTGTPCKPKLTWGYAGLGQELDGLSTQPVAVTALEPVRTQLKTIAVAYRDSVVKLFDVDTGKVLQKLLPTTFDASTSIGQINSLVSHPTMPLLVAGYEDKNIRLFDITTGECTHAIPAHVDSVTSLAIDPTGFLLASGGHDCSVRFWDLLNTRACLQESTSHREKAQEGVLQVAFHPTLPFLASAGADGVVKLYAAS